MPESGLWVRALIHASGSYDADDYGRVSLGLGAERVLVAIVPPSQSLEMPHDRLAKLKADWIVERSVDPEGRINTRKKFAGASSVELAVLDYRPKEDDS